jgi:hypothetical protein
LERLSCWDSHQVEIVFGRPLLLWALFPEGCSYLFLESLAMPIKLNGFWLSSFLSQLLKIVGLLNTIEKVVD